MEEVSEPAPLADMTGGWWQKIPAHIRERVSVDPSHTPDDDPAEVGNMVVERQRSIRHDVLRDEIPQRYTYAHAGMDALDAAQQPNAIRQWLNDASQLTLVMLGCTGSGKTAAAYATLAQACYWGAMTPSPSGGAPRHRELLARAIRVTDYLTELMPGGADEKPWLIRKRYRSEAGILLFDDLGAGSDEAERAFARREIGNLLDERIRTLKRTIITTNIPGRDLAKHFGDDIVSRMRQDATVIEFDQVDRRKISATFKASS